MGRTADSSWWQPQHGWHVDTKAKGCMQPAVQQRTVAARPAGGSQAHRSQAHKLDGSRSPGSRACRSIQVGQLARSGHSSSGPCSWSLGLRQIVSSSRSTLGLTDAERHETGSQMPRRRGGHACCSKPAAPRRCPACVRFGAGLNCGMDACLRDGLWVQNDAASGHEPPHHACTGCSALLGMHSCAPDARPVALPSARASLQTSVVTSAMPIDADTATLAALATGQDSPARKP